MEKKEKKVMVDYNTWRHDGLLPPSKLNQFNFLLIGVGGLGSPIANELVKMGVENLDIYDDDVVDSHNVPNQMYYFDQIGKVKVEALKENLTRINPNAKIRAYKQKFSSADKAKILPNTIVISALDSIVPREEIFKGALKLNTCPVLYIDTRMSGLAAQIFAINPINPVHTVCYESHLFPPGEAAQEGCTERAIMYVAFTVAGFTGAIVRNFIMNNSIKNNQMVIDFNNDLEDIMVINMKFDYTYRDSVIASERAKKAA